MFESCTNRVFIFDRIIFLSIKICIIIFLVLIQGRSQELEMGGAKLLGKGSGGHLRPPVGPGKSPGRAVSYTHLTLPTICSV